MSLWSSYWRRIFPREVTQQRRPEGHNLFRSGLGWLIILVLSVKHTTLSIFLSPCAKMPSPKISIINDTIKPLARKNQVLFFRKLVRTSRETTESLHSDKRHTFWEIKRGHEKVSSFSICHWQMWLRKSRIWNNWSSLIPTFLKEKCLLICGPTKTTEKINTLQY